MTRNASEKLTQEYREWITKEFVDQFGGSYTTAADVGDKWRTDFDYTLDRHRFLINKTKYYLRTLWSGDQKNTNLQFLEAFINKITKYLSVYTARAFESPKTRIYLLRSNDDMATMLLKMIDVLNTECANKDPKATYIEHITKAKQLLKSELYDNNQFITHTIMENSRQRIKKQHQRREKAKRKSQQFNKGAAKNKQLAHAPVNPTHIWVISYSPKTY